MTHEQVFKLEKAMELISDSIKRSDASRKIVSVWLSVASSYCKQVAKELKEK